VDLVNLALVGEVLDDGQDLRAHIAHAFTAGAEAQLETVVRTVDDRLVFFQRLEDRGGRGVPVVYALITFRQPRRIVRVHSHAHVDLFADGNHLLEKIR